MTASEKLTRLLAEANATAGMTPEQWDAYYKAKHELAHQAVMAGLANDYQDAQRTHAARARAARARFNDPRPPEPVRVVIPTVHRQIEFPPDGVFAYDVPGPLPYTDPLGRPTPSQTRFVARRTIATQPTLVALEALTRMGPVQAARYMLRERRKHIAFLGDLMVREGLVTADPVQVVQRHDAMRDVYHVSAGVQAWPAVPGVTVEEAQPGELLAGRLHTFLGVPILVRPGQHVHVFDVVKGKGIYVGDRALSRNHADALRIVHQGMGPWLEYIGERPVTLATGTGPGAVQDALFQLAEHKGPLFDAYQRYRKGKWGR